jgi:DHA1 family tetracycline resistance protein-like MFS transporter
MDRRRLFTISAIVFTNILGAGVILPILPLYAEGQFQATVFQAALLATAFFGAQFIASPWLGRLSDLYGRRPVLIFSQIGTILSFVMFIFAAPLGALIDGLGLNLGITGGLAMLFAARTLDGITGGNITAARAYVADVSTREERTHALGLLQASFGIGFIFGPAFGGVLAGINTIAPFIGAALITTGTVLLTIIFLQESLPAEERAASRERGKGPALSTLLANRNVALILSVAFLSTLAFSAIPPTFSLYADRVLFPDADQTTVIRNVGFMLTFLGAATSLTQGVLLKPLGRRFGDRNLILTGTLLFMLVMLLIPTTTSAVIVTVLWGFFAFARGISDSPQQSLLSRIADERTQGRVLGIYQSVFSLALIFGPIWAGYVFETISPRATFWVGATFLIPSSILASILRRAHIPEAEPAKATA